VLTVAGYPETIITLSVIRHHSSGYCRGFQPRSLFIAMTQKIIATPKHYKSRLFFRNEMKQISTSFENLAGSISPATKPVRKSF